MTSDMPMLLVGDEGIHAQYLTCQVLGTVSK